MKRSVWLIHGVLVGQPAPHPQNSGCATQPCRISHTFLVLNKLPGALLFLDALLVSTVTSSTAMAGKGAIMELKCSYVLVRKISWTKELWKPAIFGSTPGQPLLQLGIQTQTPWLALGNLMMVQA